MMDIRQANFADLYEMHFRQKPALTAARMLQRWVDGGKEPRPEILLRHHALHPVEDAEEIFLRDCFDSLLAFYSLIEIASLISFVPKPLEDEFQTEVSRNLSFPPLQAYYERHYPLLLPRLLRLRLSEDARVFERSDSNTTNLFSSFLALERYASQDRDMAIFTRLLDSFEVQGIGFEDVTDCIRDRRRFIPAILQPPKERGILERALHGFRAFLALAEQLDDLLHRSAEYPVLQSAMWHYHAYWFRTIGQQVGSELQDAVGRFLEWAPEEYEDKVQAEAEAEVKQVRKVVQRLVSGEYGIALAMAAEFGVLDRESKLINLNEVLTRVQQMDQRLTLKLEPEVRLITATPMIEQMFEKTLFMIMRNAGAALMGGPMLMAETANVTMPIEGILSEKEMQNRDFVMLSVTESANVAGKATIFEPFFSTRSPGTGFGLSIAQELAKSHGHLKIRKQPDGATKVMFFFPWAPAK